MLNTKYGLHVDVFKFGLGSGKHETLQIVSALFDARMFRCPPSRPSISTLG